MVHETRQRGGRRFSAMPQTPDATAIHFADKLRDDCNLKMGVAATTKLIATSENEGQRQRLSDLKAEINTFLTGAFDAANLQGLHLIDQNLKLTQALLQQYPTMQKPIAEMEVQAFCYHKKFG